MIRKNTTLTPFLAIYAKARQGRRSPNKRQPDRTSRSTASKKASAREREPWLIVASPELEAPSARQLVNLYARRMQIELGFRDLQIPSLRPRHGRQPHPAWCPAADAALGQPARQLCQLARRPGLRGYRRCALAPAPPQHTQALLDHAHWTRSVGPTMAARAGVPMVGTHACTTFERRRSDGAGAMKTWGNLRTRPRYSSPFIYPSNRDLARICRPAYFGTNHFNPCSLKLTCVL